MTLLQITAIDIDDRSESCCRGAIVQAAIGRGGEPIDADEIIRDLATGANSYFAQIKGRFVDVTAAPCSRCDTEHLTSAEALNIRIDNELLNLPHIPHPAPALVDPSAAVEAEVPRRRGNWRQRLHPRQSA